MNTLDLCALAWRNVLRNRRRTLITLAAVAVAAQAVVMLGGYVSATIKGLQTMTVRQVGHLQIMTSGYLAFGRAAPARHALFDEAALAQRLRADPELGPMLRVLTPVLQVQGVAGHFASGNASTFAAAGWAPEARAQMLAWDGLDQGFPPLAGNLDAGRPEEGVIGVGLAQLLDLCDALAIPDCVRPVATAPAGGEAIADDLAGLGRRVRDREAQEAPGVAIELLAASGTGVPNVVRMQVARAERQGVRELDMIHVGLPLALAQRLVFGAEAPGVSALVVQLHNSAQLAAAQARIETLLKEVSGQALEVQSFRAVQPSYDQIARMFRTLFGFVAVLMGAVSLFSVANTVNMAVSERVGEIGTLRALGLRRGQIRRIFLIEGGLTGLAGAALGVGLALVLSAWGVNRAGLTWTPPGNTIPVPIGIDVAGSTGLCLAVLGAMTLIACVSSWWPARRAARLHVVEALRHV